MPEGPSIVILKDEVHSFEGKKIIEADGSAKLDFDRIQNKKIESFKSWGKHFLICFDDFTIRIHFLLFGSYLINEQKTAVPKLSLVFQKGEINFYACALFEHKIATLEPSLGFELFVLEAPATEPVSQEQALIWNALNQNDKKVAEFIDRVSARSKSNTVSRYLAVEHYWPERSVKEAEPLWEKATIEFRNDLPRPIHLLSKPEMVQVTAVLPDNPPLFFRYKGKIHTVSKSDGPERIEQEWWISDGLYRDYYCVEDTEGARYWLFRSGPYEKEQPQWFLHGFFA